MVKYLKIIVLFLICLVVGFLTGFYSGKLIWSAQSAGEIATPVDITVTPKGELSIVRNDAQALVVGSEFTVNITGDTYDFPIVAADAVVEFDPAYLAYIDGGRTQDFDLLQNITPRNNRILLSGAMQIGTTRTGKFKLGSLKFKVLKSGNSELRLQFIRAGATVDSNLVLKTTSEDILNQVNNLQLAFSE